MTRLLFCCAAVALTLLSWSARADESLRFPIRSFVIEGNRQLSTAQLEQRLKAFLGEARDFADVQHALEALEDSYRRAGYGAALVQLPEQELRNGVVRFIVVEPALGQVRITGNQRFDQDNIRASLPALREGQPLNTRALAQNLRLANEHPMKQLSASLQAGAAAQTIDVQIKVKDEAPWRVFATLDNTGNSATGKQRLGVGLQHGNLWNRDHSLTLQYQTSTAHPQQVKIAGVGYRWPLYAQGDSLNLYAAYSDVDNGLVSSPGQLPIAVRGKGRVAGGRYTLTLPDAGSTRQRLDLGLEQRQIDSDATDGNGQSIASASNVDYRLQPLQIGYGALFSGGDWALDLQLNYLRNLPGGSQGDAATLQQTRSGVRPGYRLFKPALTYQQRLPADFALRLAASGQFTPDALPPAEQLGAGGANSVRGYAERELSNDKGGQVSLELLSPDAGQGRLGDFSLRLAGFYDAGWLYRNQALPGEADAMRLAGAGIGLRGAYGKYAQLRLDWARAQRDSVASEPTLQGQSRLHASLIVVY